MHPECQKWLDEFDVTVFTEPVSEIARQFSMLGTREVPDDSPYSSEVEEWIATHQQKWNQECIDAIPVAMRAAVKQFLLRDAWKKESCCYKKWAEWITRQF